MQKITFQKYENKKTPGDYIEIAANTVPENKTIIVKISGSLLAELEREKYAAGEYASIIRDHEKILLEKVEQKYKQIPECTELLITTA